MITKYFSADSVYACTICLPDRYDTERKSYQVVYLPGEEQPQSIMQLTEPHFHSDCDPFIIVGIAVENWDDCFSPWASPKIGKLGPFAGHGDAFLNILQNTIKPYIDANYRTIQDSASTTVAGYSLAGLLTLYALCTRTFFASAASVSGSLWFPHWTEFAMAHSPAVSNPRIYLSLGDRERFGKNPVTITVSECTEKTVEIFNSYAPFFEFNPGGHFYQAPYRMAKALLHLFARE